MTPHESLILPAKARTHPVEAGRQVPKEGREQGEDQSNLAAETANRTSGWPEKKGEFSEILALESADHPKDFPDFQQLAGEIEPSLDKVEPTATPMPLEQLATEATIPAPRGTERSPEVASEVSAKPVFSDGPVAPQSQAAPVLQQGEAVQTRSAGENMPRAAGPQVIAPAQSGAIAHANSTFEVQPPAPAPVPAQEAPAPIALRAAGASPNPAVVSPDAPAEPKLSADDEAPQVPRQMPTKPETGKTPSPYLSGSVAPVPDSAMGKSIGMTTAGVLETGDIEAMQAANEPQHKPLRGDAPGAIPLRGQLVMPQFSQALQPQTVARAVTTGNDLEIRLDPPELGRVRLSFSGLDGQLMGHVAAERADVDALLRRNAEFLQDALRDAGFADVSLSFGADGSAGGGEFDDAPSERTDQSSLQLDLAPSASAASLAAKGGLDIRL